MKIGDRVRIINVTYYEGRTGSITDIADGLYFIGNLNCWLKDTDLELYKGPPDMSNDPEANELLEWLNGVAEADKAHSKSLSEQMDDILSEDEEKRIHDYIAANLKLVHKIGTLHRSSEITLELKGEVLGVVKI